MTWPRTRTDWGANLEQFLAEETRRFTERRPRSREAAAQVSAFHGGVPLHWMRDWPMPFPLVVAAAQGSSITDIDGITLADFCFGDTGSMFGHSPAPVVAAITRQLARGMTHMLITEDAREVGQLLRQRFGLPHWQVATTASDANRFALRVARAVTGRHKVLVMNGCYHGAVEESFVTLQEGRAINRPGLIGQAIDMTQTSKVVEFNDLPALQAALAERDVACVMMEPALTNCSMVLPEPGYLAQVRKATRETGTLLLIDETHTISSGPRGYTGAHALDPDIFVLGKPIAGGLPASAWGFTDVIAQEWSRIESTKPEGHSGLGTTLSANALQIAAMRAVLSEVMTDAAYAHMEMLADRLAHGFTEVIRVRRKPWHVVRVGARIEFAFTPQPFKNGSDAYAAHDGRLERALHLALVNRGSLITPFHNMMLVCPQSTVAQVDALVAGFDDAVGRLP
jgi:glutamate-1-semialdehyde 2,1-aminomutase